MNAALLAAIKHLAKHIGALAHERTGRRRKRNIRLARDLKQFLKEELAEPQQQGEKSK